MARYAALICLLALLVPVAGCGGGDDDKKDAEQTVRDFVTALHERDADTFCDDLVTKEFLGEFSGATGDKARESCKRELRAVTGLENTKLVKIVSTKVNGDEAAVTAVIARSGQVPPRQRQVYRLKKEDGDWKLSGAS